MQVSVSSIYKQPLQEANVKFSESFYALADFVLQHLLVTVPRSGGEEADHQLRFHCRVSFLYDSPEHAGESTRHSKFELSFDRLPSRRSQLVTSLFLSQEPNFTHRDG